MSTTQIGKDLYTTFGSMERLQLMLAAMARRDHAEAERLCRACPRKTYSMADAAFMDRSSVAFDTAAVVAVDLQRWWGSLRVMSWARGLMEVMVEMGGVKEGTRGSVLAATTMAARNVMQRNEKQMARELAVGWVAFGRFCRSRIGVEPETLLSAWKLMPEGEVERLLKDYPDDPPDPQKVNEYFNLLCILWDQKFGVKEGEDGE